MTHALSAWATLCHVSKPAVTQGVRKGILVKSEDGKIDDAHPMNAQYLADHTGPVTKQRPAGESYAAQIKKVAIEKVKREPKVKTTKSQRKTKVKEEPEPEDDDPLLNDNTEADIREFLDAFEKDGGMQVLLIKKMQADKEYKEICTMEKALAFEKKKENLVERSQLVDLVNRFQKALSDNIHQQHAKSGPRVFALGRRDDATELEVTRALEADYGAALRRTVEEVTR